MDKLPILNSEKTGELLKETRLSAGISIEEIRKITGVSRTAIYKWETGTTVPSIDNLLILSRIFDKTIEELLVVE